MSNDQLFNTTENHKTSFETIHQVTNCHSQCNRWLIFSDLHVMPSTLSTCLQVLDTVHETAVQHNSGIMFLGDFWHHRGFVRVDCLNAVLQAMAKWKVPSIMIPGNHDQIDFRGMDHSLTPLSNAYRIHSPNEVGGIASTKQYAGPLIISQPTKFMDALFIPHTRDKEMMKSILSSNEATSSSALFVHADVKGASMNDLITSRHGLSVSIFPDYKHIYSGHFHKPHVIHIGKKSIDCTSYIRYVGSPYQTSFSESGQVKSLLLVDSKRCWQCIEEIPIDVGPRYHRVSSVRKFLDCNLTDIRMGDKVAVTVDRHKLDEMKTIFDEKSQFDIRLEEFRKSGISVEIRDVSPQTEVEETYQTEASSSGSEEKIELEDLSPKTTLAAYLNSEVNRRELGETTANRLLEHGEDLLREAKDVAINKSDSLLSYDSRTTRADVCELEIESVSVRGFGSFRHEIMYPLRNRGVVLLKGANRDDIGSDSNGVGKSTLAMASLWALAGSLDPRPTQDGKVADVVNDLSMIAEVTLRGSINAKPFLLRRTRSASAKDSSLTFELDGENLTRQSVQGTQQLIDQHFSTGLLRRTIFYGQHSIGGLLESSDAKLKEELSYLVSLDIWQESASLARLKQREQMKKSTGVEGMIALREKDKLRAQEKTVAAKAEMTRRAEVLENERRILSHNEERLPDNSHASDFETAMDLVQSQLSGCKSEIDHLEAELSTSTDLYNIEITKLMHQLNDKVAIESNAKSNLQACQRRHENAAMELKSAESHLHHLQSEWNYITSLNGDSSSFLLPESCHTCGQPITSIGAQETVRENIMEMLSTAMQHKDEAENSLLFMELALAKAKEEADNVYSEVHSCTKELRSAEEKRTLGNNALRHKIKEARTKQSRLSNDFANLARKAKEASGYDLHISRMQTTLTRLESALDASFTAYKGCITDLEAIESNIIELKREKEAATDASSLYALLAETFGPKGVQAFVLRAIVQSLKHCSHAYLDELSEGSLQLRLQVGANDCILKQAAVRNLDGTWRVRPLSSLSGGQWRRCSLALSLGYVDLASKQGRMRSSLLVLDEPLTHLDSAGRRSVGKLLRKMVSKEYYFGKTRKSSFGLSTILVILQEIAAEEIEDSFDETDEVIKLGGESFVVLDENRVE